MAEEEHSPVSAFSAAQPVLGVLAGTAAIVAFGTQPLLKFVDPSALYVVGVWLAASIFLLLLPLSFGRGRLWSIPGIVSLVVLTYYWNSALTRATAVSHANDVRCIQIEEDMLNARPARDDEPAIFQALGCRPQSERALQLSAGHVDAAPAAAKP